MKNFKLTVEYDGTKFNGWQVQAQNERTIQGKIEQALKIIFKKRIRLYGSGRTDSGVHASGQVANFKTSTQKSDNEILNAINANLPPDISIINIQEVPLDFHSQYSAKRKTYRYTILNRKARSAQNRNFYLHFPHTLNVTAMRQDIKNLVGKKDFRSFMASDTALRKTGKTKKTVRTIYDAKIQKKGDLIYIDITANGFLYKMVRNIAGTLIAVGTGKMPKGSIHQILQKKDRILAGDTAPAKGLCLLQVEY
ncbi:MAG: tRNA pseudouridine(38-40) synthase TruA [Candidatus Omnitrophica bacterium]|nr:tRNA pseudouridine(38-40) synthase TruA [Candidatus Omnitrophota bacterium]